MTRAARLTALLALAAGAAWPAEPPRYALVDLGTLGGAESEALGLNDAGQVVGWSLTADGNTHAFLHDGTSLQDLGTLGGPDSEAHDINNRGQIVGWANIAGGESHAFLYENGAMRDLAPGSKEGSWLDAINNAGMAVGGSSQGDTAEVPFWWDGQRFGPLLGLEGGVGSARDLNDTGQIVGAVRPRDGALHAFLWDVAVEDLPELGQNECWARAINASWQIVGMRARGPGDAETSPVDVFLWANTKVRDLTAETGRGDWGANDINDAGLIAGSARGGTRAVLYADGKLHELSSLVDDLPTGFRPMVACAINEAGTIAGYGRTAGGRTHAFLAKPAGAAPPAAEAAVKGAPSPGQPTRTASSSAMRGSVALALGLVAVLVVLGFVLVLALSVLRRTRQVS